MVLFIPYAITAVLLTRRLGMTPFWALTLYIALVGLVGVYVYSMPCPHCGMPFFRLGPGQDPMAWVHRKRGKCVNCGLA